jgi:cytochrome c551/c552
MAQSVLTRHHKMLRRFWKPIFAVVAALLLVGVVNSCQIINNFNGPSVAERPVQVACDTANMSYTTNVIPILQRHCYSCHAANVATGGVVLEGYNNLRDYRTVLTGVTSRLPGYIPMPPAAPLSACEMQTLRAWVNQGARNN